MSEIDIGSPLWRNIQEIVKVSIDQLNNAVRDQRAQLQRLQSSTEAAPSMSELIVSARDYMKQDIRDQVQPLQEELHKARKHIKQRDEEISRLNLAVQHMQEQMRAMEAQLQASNSNLNAQYALKSELAEKANIRDVQAAFNSTANVESVKQALSRKASQRQVEELKRDLNARADRQEVMELMEFRLAEVQQSMEQRWQRYSREAEDVMQLREMLSQKADRQELLEALHRKVGSSSLDNAIQSCSDTLRSEFNDSLRRFTEIIETVNKKAFRADVQQWLERKVDIADFRRAMDSKADIGSLAEALRRKADITDLNEIRQLATTNASNANMKQTSQRLDRVDFELRKKADSAALENIHEQIQQLSAAVHRVQDSEPIASDTAADRISTYVSPIQHSLEMLKEDVATVKRELAHKPTEHERLHIKGRWVWKTRKLTGGRLIPWDIQALNTSESHLIWTPGCTHVQAARPGLYKLSIGLFCSVPVAVTVFVNDAVILTTSTTSDKDIVQVHRHPKGDMAGLSVQHYVALPESATLAVELHGESSLVQGFMALRKL